METEKENELFSPTDRAQVLIEALPYIQDFAGKTVLIKIGGSTLVNKDLFHHFAEDMVLLHSVGIKPVVVHGGGPQIGERLATEGKESTFIDGLRVTDEETLAIVKEVLKEEVGKGIADAITNLGGKAVSVSGEESNLIRAEQRNEELGYVGDISKVSTTIIKKIINEGYIPVISTIGKDEKGQSLNINADTAAGALAGSLKVEKVVYLSDVPGLLLEKSDPQSLISVIADNQIETMIGTGGISDGMIPKVTSCIEALKLGAQKAHLLDGRIHHVVLLELFTDSGIGTMIIGGGTQ
ncbi:MAG: acetylglutamate kinase [Acidimicrobiales bacterium]|jgi:acetylglutamate kinase|nr:acetylglutamate kinase [Acidimicrobiales bacterium]MDP6298672.1 acetylglutamate kinase [Acidimicrobiales bacterium]HJM28848.1 acetylglutamate kinase [Acidimicrobiales bacterium]HJM97109.1 acetylglutamate kinase [Acidimicrobiales bacterium]